MVTSIRDDEKASLAKENLKRRMTYDPRKSAMYGSPAMRSIGSAGKSPGSSIFDETKNSGRALPKFQVRNTNEVGKRLLDKRLSYIPDLKKRAQQTLAAEAN
jgi:hypothetical protein